MKHILIAGYEAQTVHYRNAFSMLGTSVSVLCPSPEQLVPEHFRNVNSLACLCDGLVLPGGGDISPSLLHSENQGSRNIDEALDRIQFSLLHAFIQAGKPVLGICKGLQLINAGFGGTIRQDLNPASLSIHAWNGGDRIHTTKAARGTFLFQLYGACPVVNSAHHQAIASFGTGLRAAQYAQDFVVEALYHERLPVFGVQWHPERLCFAHARGDAADGALLLKYFISQL